MKVLPINFYSNAQALAFHPETQSNPLCTRMNIISVS